VHHDELDHNRFGFLFREQKPRMGWRDIVATAREVIGKDASTAMAEKGVTIHNSDAWRMFCRASIDRWHQEHAVETRYDQFGWKDEDKAFLVGKRLYTPTEVIDVAGNVTLEQRSAYLIPSKAKGASYDRWRRAANKMFAEGLEHQSFALLCGFAAPLMRFHAEGEGGAIAAFVSDRTSSGKTTALEAAASVWGQHRGLKLDETDTRVAKGLKLGLLGNLPCTYDELHQRDPELIRQFVLTFTNGTDKDRGTNEGGLRVNKAEWQTILLLASNTSIVDKLSNFDASDAPAARIFELNTAMPDYITKEDFDDIRRELATNSGFAGDLYLKKLVQPEIIAWIKQNIPNWSASVRQSAELSDRHRFWVRLIVSVIAAGTIVEKYGILDFSMARITRWLLQTARDNKDMILGQTNIDHPGMLGLFINDQLKNTLSVARAYKPGQRVPINFAPSGPLICRFETDERRLYVSETHLKKWLVQKSVNIQGFLAGLRDKTIMENTTRKVTLGAGTDFASGQTSCYTVNMAHPAMTGVVIGIEHLQPDPKVVPKRQRSSK
jgi:hypothetical protein